MVAIHKVYLGFETKPSANMEKLACIGPPPSNYKDPVAIENWTVREIVRIRETANTRPLLGEVVRMYALAEDGKQLFDGSAVDAMTFIAELYARADGDINYALYALHPYKYLRLVYLTALHTSEPGKVTSLFEFDQDKLLIRDPIQTVMGANDEKEIGTIVRYLSSLGKLPPGFEFSASAANDALFMRTVSSVFRC